MNKVIHPMEPEELMAYLDGELPSDRTEIAALHLRECPECREVVAGLRRVSQGLVVWEAGSTDVRVPAALASALDENVERMGKTFVVRPTWRGVLRRNWKQAAWVGAFAVIAMAVYVVPGEFRVRDFKRLEIDDDSRPAERLRSQAPGDYMHAPTAPASLAAGSSQEANQYDHLQQSAKLLKAPPSKLGTSSSTDSSTERSNGPMIIRTAQLALITKDFDNTRSTIEAILKRHRGYLGELKVGGSTGSGRTLNATLRVPADQLDASLTELKGFGRVESESQTGQDVTSQYVDLQARLANSRNTEQRLTDLLRNRTGKLSDVLEVEQEVDRVRGEIEQMEAERKSMSNQVGFATLNVTIKEDYQAQLQVVPPSTWTRLINAAISGYKDMVEGVMSLALFLLEVGPTLLFWIAVLFLPARLVWKKVRRSFAS
ncbi:MAG: DUF4349 domain-containing protein [Acidobacteria bacterium]|nr:DUF4349 domain-containing protein [Acidobacteriota bacterium]